MAQQTGQHGYLFKFDKVNATAPLIFSHLIIFSSGAALADIYEPVDNASGEIIIRFFKYIIPRLSKDTRFHACQRKCYFGVCQSKWGVRTESWTGICPTRTCHSTKPSLRLYSRGLNPPSDILIRFSAYQ